MRNIRVLVMDDDESVRYLHKLTLKRKLATYHIEFVEAQNGTEGLVCLAKKWNTPTFVIMDIEMPGMDGHLFLKEYSEHQWSEVPLHFFVSSNCADPNLLEQMAKTGMVTAFFEKPLSEENIAHIITKIEETFKRNEI